MLEARGLSVRYGPVEAATGIDVSVSRGEIVAVIGANGSGKSSLLNALAGLVPASGGSVALNGHAITGLDAPSRVRRGLSLVVEGRGLLGDLSVRENLELGTYAKRALRRRNCITRGVERMVVLFPRLGERMSQAAATLSGGEQQMLAIARALMSEPDVLLLDEPSLGLAPKVVDEIAVNLRALAYDARMGILVAEQNAVLGLDLATRALVLQQGHCVLSGSSEQIRSDEDLLRLYMGSVT